MSRRKMVKLRRNAVKIRLTELGLKQIDIVDAIGIDETYLSKALANEKISEHYLDKIADFLGCLPQDISDIPVKNKGTELKKGLPLPIVTDSDFFIFTKPGRYADLDTIIRLACQFGFKDRIQSILDSESLEES